MSLVSNFIGGISSTQFGKANGITNNFDLDDTTFADLLQKQIDKSLNSSEPNMSIEGLGMPAGINIEQFEGIDNFETEEISKIENNEVSQNNLENNNEQTSSEAVTFFSSLLDNNSNSENGHPDILDFARKQATNLYNKYSRSVITDVNEFVDDIKNMIS